MSLLLAAATAAVLAVTARTDTTFDVPTGSRLSLENFGGSISVKAWNRNAIRVEAEHGRRTEVVVERDGRALEVSAEHSRGIPVSVDYKLTVPAWMPLQLEGTYTDISVEGSRAKIEARTVRGDITVRGGADVVALESVEGSVDVSGAKGRIEISSVNEDVRVDGVEGELVVEGVRGDVWLYNVKSDAVEASTVTGDIVYEGELRAGGRYSFTTHNGDIGFAIGEKGHATVSVATFSGNFESSFPVNLSETRRGKRFKFTVGNGGASVDLESFQGTIYVVRPGAKILRPGAGRDADSRAKDKHKDHDKDRDQDQDEDRDDGRDPGCD